MKRTIRVLVVSSKYMPEYAGSALRAHRTYQRLGQKYNITFDVLCSSITENSNSYYYYDGVPVQRIACKMMPRQSVQVWDHESWMEKLALRFNYISEGIVTFRYLKRRLGDYDLVHVFGNVAVTSMVITLCNIQKKSMIVEVTYHSRPQQYKPLFMHWIDRTQNGFHARTYFVCISRKLEKMCREFGIEQEIWTRPNPVDTAKFHVERQRRDEYRSKHTPFVSTDIILVNVTKFMPLKNQIFLLDVLKQLPDKFKLVLAGPLVEEGPNAERDQQYFRSIQERVRELGLEDRVCLHKGFVEEVDEFLKMADVYLFPSKIEGLGTPMIESLCCGVPVVAFQIDDVTDAWIKEGVSGYTCDLNAQLFAQKVWAALDLEKHQLDQEALAVQNAASQEAVDEQYYQIVQSLVNQDAWVKN